MAEAITLRKKAVGAPDTKNAVRERMAKTGESYSIARMQLTKPALVGSARSFAKEGPGILFSLRVTLHDVVPEIWRQLTVPADLDLGQLSIVLIQAMGWTNSHLHEFTVSGLRYAEPFPGDDDFDMPDSIDEATMTLRQIVASGIKKFTFVYDFGDHWAHHVEIESINVEPLPGVSYPACVAGQRACPPEDCGGVPGYERLLEALKDPEHEEHQSLRRWVGKAYDPEKFNVKGVNVALAKHFQKARRQARSSGPARLAQRGS